MFMLNRISLCILSKLDPSRSGRPSESLVNVIQYRRCGRRYSIRCGAWRPMLSVLSRGRSVQCSWRVYQDRVLLSIEVPEYDRHGIESGPWGFADFRRPANVLDQGTHHSSLSNLAAPWLEFGHGVEGALQAASLASSSIPSCICSALIAATEPKHVGPHP